MSLSWSLEKAGRRVIVLRRSRLGDKEAFVSNTATYTQTDFPGTTWNMALPHQAFPYLKLFGMRNSAPNKAEKSLLFLFRLSIIHWTWVSKGVKVSCILVYLQGVFSSFWFEWNRNETSKEHTLPSFTVMPLTLLSGTSQSSF